MASLQHVMLSLPKHPYRDSKWITYAVEMLRQAQHDVLFLNWHSFVKQPFQLEPFSANVMHKLYTSILLFFAVLLGACASSVHIRALAPAAVPMPTNLQSVATANHIIPESRRNKFFDVLEGAFTGEGVGMDRAGADECVNVAGQALANNSYRFRVTQAQLLGRGRNRVAASRP